MLLCNYHQYLDPINFHHLKQKLHTHEAITPHFPIPHLLVNTNLFYVGMDLPILDTSHN